MKRMKTGIRKLNNRGSALVTVLVVTAFISIIATTLLYITAQNYQMKQTDYQNKQSFYQAEKAIDTLKGLLVEDVQAAYLKAYSDTMNNYLKLGDQDARQSYYQQHFRDELEAIWDARIAVPVADPDPAATRLNALKTYMTGKGFGAEADCIYSFDGYDPDAPVQLVDGSTKEQFVVMGVKAKFTSGTYTNFLCTDICLMIPELDLNDGTSHSANAEIVPIEDCVIYMNWHKADYDE